MNRLHFTALCLFVFQAIAIKAEFRDDVIFSVWCAVLASLIAAEACAVLTRPR